MRKGMLVIVAMVSLFVLTSCSPVRKIGAMINPEEALKNPRGCQDETSEEKKVRKEKEEKAKQEKAKQEKRNKEERPVEIAQP